MEKQGEKYDRYSYEELSAFCLQIALLLEAAVPLEEGLTIMAEDAAEEKEKAMTIRTINDIVDYIENIKKSRNV